MTWIVEGFLVGAVVWLMASAHQLLYGNLQSYDKFFLAFSFVFYVGIAILVSGLQFYGAVPIGGR